VVSALVFIVLLFLSAVDPRMTIHHSFSIGRQELSSVLLRRWLQVSSGAEQHRMLHETQPAMGVLA
jgi:predicted secreted Zn-dependent protease